MTFSCIFKEVMVLGDLEWYMQKKKKKKEKKPDHQFTLHTKINSEWIKDLNMSHDTIKVLEKNIGSKISDIPCSNIFADVSPRVRDKGKLNKWDYIKLKSFCIAEKPIIEMKRELTI